MGEYGRGAVIMAFALGFLFGAAAGGGGVWVYLDGGGCPSSAPPRIARTTDDGDAAAPESSPARCWCSDERAAERVAKIIADAKKDAETIRQNALLIATAVAEEYVNEEREISAAALDALADAEEDASEIRVAAFAEAAAIIASAEAYQCSVE